MNQSDSIYCAVFPHILIEMLENPASECIVRAKFNFCRGQIQ